MELMNIRSHTLTQDPSSSDPSNNTFFPQKKCGNYRLTLKLRTLLCEAALREIHKAKR